MAVNNASIDSSSELQESIILKRILNGEKELFEILIRRNNQKLFRIIRSFLKNEVDARDVMQETYIKAFVELSQFQQNSSFSTWLIKIGINESLHRLKKQNRRQQVILQGIMESELETDALEVSEVSPERIVIQQESHAQIEAAIDHLPEKYRSVYVMREIEGFSVFETAHLLNLSEDNVKVRLYRAKERLKVELSELHRQKVFEFGNHHCDRIRSDVMHHLSTI